MVCRYSLNPEPAEEVFVSNVKLVVLCLLLSFSLFSCSGEDGATGPVGPAGLDGEDGENGNAEVIMYEFGTQTTTSGMFTYNMAVSQELVDSSLILVYTKPSSAGDSAWYPSPGIGDSGYYNTRWYIFQTNPNPSTYLLNIKLLVTGESTVYTASTTFDEVRIFIVPASEIIVAAESGELDLNDHDAVVRYLKL